MKYFECDVPPGDGVCSDNNCPCPEVKIPRGTGYLYIDQELVNFRRQYTSMRSAREAMQQRQVQMRASLGTFTGFYRLGPILVCKQGAKRRKLDLEVAAADAEYWWKTAKVPLRATPLARSKKADRNRKEKKETRDNAGSSRKQLKSTLSESQKPVKKWWQFWK